MSSDLIVRNSSQSVHQKIQVFVRRLFGANLDGHCKDMATPHSLLSKALGPSEFQQLQEFYAYHPGLPAPHQRAGAGAPPPAAGRAKPRKTPSAGARRAAEAKRREEIYRGFDGSLYQHGHMAAAGQASQKQPAGHVHLTPDQFMHQQHAMGRMPPPASHPALQPPPAIWMGVAAHYAASACACAEAAASAAGAGFHRRRAAGKQARAAHGGQASARSGDIQAAA